MLYIKMYYRNFGIIFKKSIRRRLIVNEKYCINNQKRLTNISQMVKKPTRFTYRIEYHNIKSFTPHLLFQG